MGVGFCYFVNFFFILCVTGVLPTYMTCVCPVCAPGTVVTGGYEPPCMGWESNSGPPGKQQVLLTTEQSLQLKLCKKNDFSVEA